MEVDGTTWREVECDPTTISAESEPEEEWRAGGVGISS